jgi:hypothetical protein
LSLFLIAVTKRFYFNVGKSRAENNAINNYLKYSHT